MGPWVDDSHAKLKQLADQSGDCQTLSEHVNSCLLPVGPTRAVVTDILMISKIREIGIRFSRTQSD